jgi:hypothetical protein
MMIYKTIRMKLIYSLMFLAALLLQSGVYAQDATEEPTGPDNRPAKPAFESGLLFDQQTANMQQQNTLEFVIQHRFGTVEDGISNLYGIWGASNIRLGLNYTLLKNVMVGWGTTKYKKAQDFQVKYNFLQQTRSNSMPVSLTLYGDMQVDCQNKKDDVNNVGNDYKTSDRFSYFTQLIITRRFNNHFSIQVAPSFTHYNWLAVDTINSTVEEATAWEHDKIGISGGLRYKISPQTSLMAAVDWPLKIQGIAEYKELLNTPKPNFCIGAEISTSTHAFHIWFGTSQAILPQEVMMWNQNDFFNKQFLIGLNITRLWNF